MLQLSFRLGALLGAIAVVLGALGAHALPPLLEPDSLKSYETAVRYHFYHSLALLIAGALAHRLNARWGSWAVSLMLAGTLLFSGSIYLLSTRDLTGWAVSWLGPITPLGGLLLIVSWLLLIPAWQASHNRGKK